jgi:very-short-patch-repair endonuclease
MSGMRTERDTPDRGVARIAARQHGVVTRTQLQAAGLSGGGIARRVHAGRIHRLFQGVYAVGHRCLSNEGRWMAAVLASGAGAALSHRSAAELWGLLRPRKGTVSVSVPGRGGRHKRPGIRLHRSPSLLPFDVTRHKGIPVTTPARTIKDLRRVATTDELRRAIREGEFRRLPIGEAGGREQAATRSLLERRFLRLCRRHRFPAPEVNVQVGRHEVDFLWRDRKLVVETDGYEGHRGRQAFEDDRAKDAELRVLGYTVVRFTYRQVTGRWEWVEETVRALLAGR